MEELIRTALEAAQGPGVRFADVRAFTAYRYEKLSVKNGIAEALTRTEEAGIGIRVLRERGWGFAGTSERTPAAVRRAAERAARLAAASERTRKEPVPFTEERDLPHEGRYETPLQSDPFQMDAEEKIRHLRDAEAELHVDPAVKVGRAHMTFWQEDKWYLSSEGASYRASLTHSGAGIEATAVGEGEVQRRSYPTSFGGNFAQGGFEFVSSLDLRAHAREVGRTAVELLTARAAPRGSMDLVLASDQLALQVHESVGHATELDRILAYEAGFAGTSFLTTAGLGTFRYGSPAMNITADATRPGGLGTFPWDDEGVPGQKYSLVKEGILVDFLSSREMAARIGRTRSGGTARGDGYLRTPLIRMTNVNLEPGERSAQELLHEVRDGIYMETNRSWSIDDKRLNFQFGCEVGRRIRGGELGPLLRNPIYSGMTPKFWSSLEAVGGPETWRLWGLPNCGKGQPGQVMRVGHGAPMGLFRKARVGGPR